MSCSKGSDAREYANFLSWAQQVFPKVVFEALPSWAQVEGWRGKMIATCSYEASETPGPVIWNEGYRYWWHLSDVHPLSSPYPVRGNVGMWQIDNPHSAP